MIPLLLLAVFCGLMSAFYSGVETGVYRLNRIRLRKRCEAGDPRALALSRLLKRPRSFVLAILVGNNLANYGISAVFTAFMVGVSERYAEALATLALSPILLVFAEVLPKSVFHGYANKLMYRLSWLLALSNRAYWPVTQILRGVSAAVDRLFGVSPEQERRLTVRRLFDYFTEGAREGALSSEQHAMARNVMRFVETPVEQAMIPLEEVKMISADASPDELRATLSEHPHTRIPVYRGEPHRIEGVVHLIDFLCAEGQPGIGELVRPVPSVAATDSVGQAFAALQRDKQVMGVARDAEQRAVGIVTMKDIVEEVVGEIHEW